MRLIVVLFHQLRYLVERERVSMGGWENDITMLCSVCRKETVKSGDSEVVCKTVPSIPNSMDSTWCASKNLRFYMNYRPDFHRESMKKRRESLLLLMHYVVHL